MYVIYSSPFVCSAEFGGCLAKGAKVNRILEIKAQGRPRKKDGKW